ncbi:MAG TPA: hypothetical protein VGR72_11365 [Candidatus Acidoferrales bacterium]|nr:hypothetical protein [Candidatus Acidoferrales bacterium]
MAQAVDEAGQLSRAIQQSTADSFLRERRSRWESTSERSWKMSLGDAKVQATVVSRLPNGAPERVSVDAELPGRLEQLGHVFSVPVGEFLLADVGLL